MEVIIRNVPRQSGNSQLKSYLRPYMDRLSIRGVDYNNSYNSTRAFLTFLHAEDGLRFLYHHGQNQREPGALQSTNISKEYILLKFLGQRIFCEKGRQDASPVVLRGLAREERERIAGADSKRPHHQLKLPMSFHTSLVSIGNLAYEGSQLVFIPQYHLKVNGEAKFGRRSMILTLETGIRMDFIYSAIESITTEIEPNPCFIFSMQQNPRLFKQVGNAVEEVTNLLGVMAANETSSIQWIMRNIERQRLAYLDAKHQPIAGHCLAYRVQITATTTIRSGLSDDNSTKMFRLEKDTETPRMIQHRTRVVQPIQPYPGAFQKLHSALSSPNSPLPFEVSFQVQRLAQNNCLSPATVLQLCDTIADILKRSGPGITVAAVRKFYNQIPFPSPLVDASDFELSSLIELLKENEQTILKNASTSLTIYDGKSKNVAVIHRVKVTPMGTYLSGPDTESSNRILRKYPHNHDFFLRVQFCDEDGNKLNFNAKVSNYPILHKRFKGILENGITIADRTFSFLGSSNSSFRMQSCWFVAPFVHNGGEVRDRDIIRELGNFSGLKAPAKCAARIGQAFSDTRTAVLIRPEQVQIMPDIKLGSFIFSDGVGTLSAALLEKIVGELPKARRSSPTCLQIRYRGAKGMVSLDSRLQGEVLCLRNSMIKFDGSDSNDIEICDATYKPLPVFLNRQFIKIMEDMGVEDKWFMDLQDQEIERLRLITDSPINAASFLKRQGIGEHFNFPQLITGLAMVDLDFKADGFLSNILEVAYLSELRLLKHKTRIPVPKGWHLHGIMDETGVLDEGEIFCVVMMDGIQQVISGDKLLVTRAPALHPGDIQLVKGVVPPLGSPLLQLANCVCFSQKGSRDLPSQLSGGDLDGDRYYVIWDELAMPKQTFTLADYPRKLPLDIGRAVTRSDMTDFFLNYMESDQLGRIAVGHRVLADQKSEGTLDEDCVTLAELHSDAVDFSKTGIPPDMSRMPKYKPWRPDFEAPGPHVEIHKFRGISFQSAQYEDPMDMDDEDDDFNKYRYYESDRVLGRLYRAIDEQAIFQEIQQRAMGVGESHESIVINALWKQIQGACKLIQWDHLMDDARSIRDMYESCLQNIMTAYSAHPTRPLSELEVFAGTILGRDGTPTKSQREFSITMKEQFEEDTLVIVNYIIKDGDQPSNQSLEMSMACLSASLEDRPMKRGRSGAGEQLLSFKYLAAAVCLREVERLAVPIWKGVQLLEG